VTTVFLFYTDYSIHTRGWKEYKLLLLLLLLLFVVVATAVAGIREYKVQTKCRDQAVLYAVYSLCIFLESSESKCCDLTLIVFTERQATSDENVQEF
jgi:hypothetical protein